ncbi:hypothetical protein [Stenotrophomonas maltophilia]|uniref:hypothetical protein n=1 Tax=Stenotrophomonas maltophilia TaxID=40324 RepID=UPI000A2F927A|nr:hypothetical protein [Stenotrophomonas maltophilia]ARQ89191.1 hypothetical protein A7326_06120 [Stenotrophomonas maltophilia]
METNKWKWFSARVLMLTLSACGSEPAPSEEDAVKAVERFFTEQGRQATLQRSWRLEVTDANGLKLECEKQPNGGRECQATGKVEAIGYIGGQPTTPEAKEMRLKMRMTFRPAGDGWELVNMVDEGTGAG